MARHIFTGLTSKGTRAVISYLIGVVVPTGVQLIMECTTRRSSLLEQDGRPAHHNPLSHQAAETDGFSPH